MFISEKKVLRLMSMVLLFQITDSLLYRTSIQIPPFWRALITALFYLTMTIYLLTIDRPRAKAKLSLQHFIILWVFVSACLYLFTYFVLGFIDGFGNSPYDNSAISIIKSIFLYGTVLVCKEWIRSYVINMVQKRFALLVGISLVLLYTFISINWNPLFSMDKPKDFLVFFTSRVFVSLALNSYLTYVSYLAGPMPSIIYVLVTQAPIWFMNPLPNLSWLTTSVLGISFPVLSLDIIMNAYHKQTKVIKPHEYQGSNPYSWIVIAAFSVIMVWFSVGLFPVSPSLVITKSMQPGIDPGDVVIIKKVDTQSLKTGDIIKYWDGKCFITHRIVDIYTEEDKTYFITKGDANSLEDDPVSPEQVRGVLMFTIPKIGKLPLWIRTQLAIS